jgi:hypothetical protein
MISVTQCAAFAGLASDELILGVAPSVKHRSLLSSYLLNLELGKLGPIAVRDMIVADMRRFRELGALQRAADLLLVLRLFLTIVQSPDAARSGTRLGRAKRKPATSLEGGGECIEGALAEVTGHPANESGNVGWIASPHLPRQHLRNRRTIMKLSKRAAFAIACAGIAVWAGPGRTRPIDPASLLTLKHLQGVSFDIGTKRAVSYFLSDGKACNLTVMLAERAQDEEVNGLIATRMIVAVESGKAAHIDTADGQSLEFKCQAEAHAMSIDVSYQASN